MIEKLERASPKLRNAIRELHHADAREQRQEFLVEGPHACLDVIKAGLRAELLVIADDASVEAQDCLAVALLHGVRCFAASSSELQRMGTTKTTQGVVMVMSYLPTRELGKRIVALDGVADPGNVGTIIRSASWFGCTDVVTSSDCADVYNPKVVRASAGALASINIVRRADLSSLLATHPEIQAIAAVAAEGTDPSGIRLPDRWCLVIGSEAHGVSPTVMKQCSIRTTIPRHGLGAESLNAAVAASILLYELAGRR
ncbi:MAG: RNA methyltransferase [Candidatus Kapabacteria bacterium]|nr:RNA methyltransferase [Candidatus Kapabacteria bacterium]